MHYIDLLFFFIIPCCALNFVIPLPNTLILAGASSLVTWDGLGNATATNLYLGNGANKDQMTIIKIFGQNMPNSKKSIWITLPKDTPSDNTYLVLEANDTPPTRATVPLNVGLGSTATPSAVPTGPSSSPPLSSSVSVSSSSSFIQSSSLSILTKTDQPTSTPSDFSASSSGDVSATNTQSLVYHSDSSLSAGQAAGVIIGSISAAGLALAAIFIIRRKRRLNNHKRHTELFDEKEGYHNHPHYTTPSPLPPSLLMTDQSNYSRPFGHTQSSAYYPMNTIDSTKMQENGFQSRTQLSSDGPPITISKPDEATLADGPHKPHSKS